MSESHADGDAPQIDAPLVVPTDPWLEVPRRMIALADEVRSALELLLATEAGSARASEPTSEAEAIHDFRVALRRLRSLLRPLRASLGKKPMRRLADRLREVAALTGELRDEEVLRETLAELELSDPTQGSLATWMTGRRRREAGMRARVLSALRRDHARADRRGLEATLRELGARLETTPTGLTGDASFSAHALEDAWYVVLTRADAAWPRGSEALHRLRIALKRLRYAAEVFGDRAKVDARSVEKRASKLQKLLGHLNDLEEARRRMARAWGLETGPRAEVLAALDRAREATLSRVEREVPRELSGIGKAMRQERPPTPEP